MAERLTRRTRAGRPTARTVGDPRGAPPRRIRSEHYQRAVGGPGGHHNRALRLPSRPGDRAGVSGTAEEIQRANAAGKPVHVYFSQEPLPRNVDGEQLAALRAFQSSLESQGLLGSYATPDDLGFQVRNAVEQDLNDLDLRAVHSRRSTKEHAILRATYVPQARSGGRIRITNHGTVTAEKVAIALEPLSDLDVPILHDADVRPDIIAMSHYDFPVIMYAGSGNANVVLTWSEGDAEQTVIQALAF